MWLAGLHVLTNKIPLLLLLRSRASRTTLKHGHEKPILLSKSTLYFNRATYGIQTLPRQVCVAGSPYTSTAQDVSSFTRHLYSSKACRDGIISRGTYQAFKNVSWFFVSSLCTTLLVEKSCKSAANVSRKPFRANWTDFSHMVTLPLI